MSSLLEFTILGSGSSGGVPRADGSWGVCDPADPRNRRARCSMMIRRMSGEGPERWTTVVELSLAMAEFIENFYNPSRRHSSLNYLTPNEFENLQLPITQITLA